MRKTIEKRIRVMHFVGSLRTGGAEKVVTTLLKNIDRERYQAYVMVFKNGALEAECRAAGCSPIVKPLKGIGPLRLFHLPFWLLSVRRELRRSKIDVLHTHLSTSDILGRIAARIAGVPVVISTFHSPAYWKQSKRPVIRLKQFADRVTANFLTDGMTAVSREVKEFQVGIGGIDGAKIRVIGNPVALANGNLSGEKKECRRRLGVVNENHTVFTNVANLRTVKGQKYLIRAFAELKKKHKDISLLIVGEGNLRAELTDLSRRLGVGDSVHLLGYRQDVPEILCASDVFVMPSLNEGVSIAILEAMGAGLPVVATAVGGNETIVRHRETGLVTPPADSCALADAMATMSAGPEQREQYGKAGVEFVIKNYDAASISRQLEAFYEEKLVRAE